jgi:hypothetical protein
MIPARELFAKAVPIPERAIRRRSCPPELFSYLREVMLA